MTVGKNTKNAYVKSWLSTSVPFGVSKIFGENEGLLNYSNEIFYPDYSYMMISIDICYTSTKNFAF